MDFNIMTREAYDRLIAQASGVLVRAHNLRTAQDDNPPPQQPAPKADITDPSVPFHAGCDD